MKKYTILLLCLFLAFSPFAKRGQAAPFAVQAEAKTNPAAVATTGGAYLSIPAAAFTPRSWAQNWENHGRYIKSRDAGTGVFNALLPVPHGASISKISACFYDDSGSADGQVILYRAPVGSTYDGTALSTLTSATSAGYIVRSDSSSVILINQTGYAYWLELRLPQSNGDTSGVWGCGVFVEYSPSALTTRTLTLPGAAFNPMEGGNTYGYERNGNFLHLLTGGGSTDNGHYLAHVDLPHGATVTSMTLRYVDERDDAAFTAWLQRGNSTGVFTSLGHVSSTGSASLVSTSDFSNATIDNVNYAYWIYLDAPISYVVEDTMAVESINIVYQMPDTFKGSVSLSNAPFTGFYEDYNFENHGNWLFHTQSEGGGSGNGTYLSAVNLPQGARVSSFRVASYDASTSSGTALLVRARQGVNETLAQGTTSGSSGYNTVIDYTIDHPMVDNSQYAYYVYWNLPVASTPPPPGTGDVVGCRIYIEYDFSVFLPLVRK